MFIIVVILSLIKNRPRLLLHICCAPCGFYSASILKQEFNLTLYFSNSNLSSEEEYNRRLDGVKYLARKYSLPLIIDPYKHQEWLEEISGLENEPEKGKRCFSCFYYRLRLAASLGKKKNFSHFATTLTISPYKDKEVIDKICLDLAQRHRIKYLDRDLRADNAFKRSQELAKANGLYRQNYCGCEFSQK